MPAYRPEAERFWEKVAEDENGCWLWTAGKNAAGYGAFGVRDKVVRAHRWAYEQMVAEIPEGLVLDHLCRVRHCVNPYHCDPVTDLVNSRRGARWLETCARGHDMSQATLYPTDYGFSRRCNECRKEYMKDYYRRQKQGQKL